MAADGTLTQGLAALTPELGAPIKSKQYPDGTQVELYKDHTKVCEGQPEGGSADCACTAR